MVIIQTLNWGGLVLGAVLAFGIGLVWFSPKVFGNKFELALGKTPDPKRTRMSASALSLQAVYTLLLAIFIAVLHYFSGPPPTQPCPFVFSGLVGLLIILQFLGIYSGAMLQHQNRPVPCLVGGYKVVMTLVIAVTVFLTASYF